MSRRAASLAGLALLGACSPGRPPPTAWERAFGNETYANQEAQVEAADDGSDRCYRREIHHGMHILRHMPYSSCLDTGPQQVMHGVWFNVFEGSGFIPDVDHVLLHREFGRDSTFPEMDIWLDLNRPEALRRMGIASQRGDWAYEITFVGRRSLPHRNRDGTPATAVIVVDGLLSGRPLGELTFCIRRDFFEGAAVGPRAGVNLCPESVTPRSIDRRAPAP